MTVHDVLRSLNDFYEPTLGVLQLWVWGLPLFALVVGATLFFDSRRNGIVAPTSLIGKIFPRNMYSHSSGRVDRLNAMLILAIGFPVYSIVEISAIALAEYLANGLGTRFGTHAPWIHANWSIVAIQFAVYFLSLDFAGYWIHYWCHTVPWMWNLHKPHHTAETLTPWTNFRQHPIEFFVLNKLPTLFAGVTTGLALYAMGTPIHPGTAVVIGLQIYIAFFVVDFLSHVHVPISYGWLNRIILAPVMHNIHHSLEDRHRDKNMAVILTVWDWMFGTLYLPRDRETWRWGLNRDEYGETNPHKTLRGFYLEPFVSSWKLFRQTWLASARKTVHQDAA